MELAANIVAARAASTKSAIAMAVLKKQHEADMSFVNMIEQVAKSAPAPSGQGTRIDVTA
jgi:hypothetical protein